MRIHSITVNNFKSLVDFQLNLAKFSCLIGLNGSGKSTVLQFIDFLSQQVHGDIEGWLEERHWRLEHIKSRLKSHSSRKRNLDFSVSLTDDSGSELATWKGSFNPEPLHCTHEQIRVGDAYLKVDRGVVEYSGTQSSTDPTRQEIAFTYQGSILSQLKESSLPGPLVEFKQFLLDIQSLDLLSPEHLRKRTRESGGAIGLGGQRLSAFLHELGKPKQRRVVERLKSAYPQLDDVYTKALQSGWKELGIVETYPGTRAGFFPRMKTEARHVADGVLRLIAILTEIEAGHRFLLFDEIENGINPELVEFVLDALVCASQQVLVTTHSPVILNYLEDRVAREGVIYLYKTAEGQTRAVKFFDIPSLAEKLTVMGPGEAFADTDLTHLSDEISAVGMGG